MSRKSKMKVIEDDPVLIGIIREQAGGASAIPMAQPRTSRGRLHQINASHSDLNNAWRKYLEKTDK